jgi:hypothetical protein
LDFAGSGAFGESATVMNVDEFVYYVKVRDPSDENASWVTYTRRMKKFIALDLAQDLCRTHPDMDWAVGEAGERNIWESLAIPVTG